MWTAADIEAWAAEIKPLSLNKTPTLRVAAEYFQQHMLFAEVSCPIGHRVSLSLGHFFPLVCMSTPGDPSKGWVEGAASLQEAFERILSGVAEFKHLKGCQPQRVAELPLFFDTIASPHVIARKSQSKFLYLKRYQNPKLRMKVAVVHMRDGLIKPASFYTTDIKVEWLNKNAGEVIWQKKGG